MYNWSEAQKKIKDSGPLPTQWTCNWESGRSPPCLVSENFEGMEGKLLCLLCYYKLV